MPAEKFSLKDHLFNQEKITQIAKEIQAVYPPFKTQAFIQSVLRQFPQQELMERMYWVRECLRTYLPESYRAAVAILLEALPPPLNPTLRDDDFGDYIYGAYGNFVSQYGATEKDGQFSLTALRTMTTRFSCEFPIRVFLNEFPKETLRAFAEWSTDPHYHVRRLVSEGSRPKLPWAKKITLDYTVPLAFLDTLHADPTRFVTRSVANHLNDISKLDAELVVQTLKRWRKISVQNPKELDFITHHALRTLLKQGHAGALDMLGYQAAAVEAQLAIKTPQVQVGKSLIFTAEIHSTSKKPQIMHPS